MFPYWRLYVYIIIIITSDPVGLCVVSGVRVPPYTYYTYIIYNVL